MRLMLVKGSVHYLASGTPASSGPLSRKEKRDVSGEKRARDSHYFIFLWFILVLSNEN